MPTFFYILCLFAYMVINKIHSRFLCFISANLQNFSNYYSPLKNK